MARRGDRHRRRSRRGRGSELGGMRTVLRVVGPLLLICGLALLAVGIHDFTSSFGSFDRGPSRFWMCFLGVPLMGIGTMLTKFAYIGPAARYVVDETRDSVRDLVGAVAEGMRGGGDPGESHSCHECGEENDVDARFCDRCGAALETAPACPACGQENDGDARFCDAYGAALHGG